jgi:hypothetical protein
MCKKVCTEGNYIAEYIKWTKRKNFQVWFGAWCVGVLGLSLLVVIVVGGGTVVLVRGGSGWWW